MKQKNNKIIFVILASLFLTTFSFDHASAAGACGSYDVTTIQLIVNVNPDGICGPETQAAIKVWQEQHGLTADGIVGPQTAARMELTSTKPGSETAPETPSGNVPDPSVRTPESGNAPDGNRIKCPEGLEGSTGVCLPPNPYKNRGIAGADTVVGLVTIILKALLFLGGIIAVVFIVIGGFWYMTAGGDEEQVEKGRKALVNAAIGLVVIILAYTMVTIITNALTGSIDKAPATQRQNK